MFIYCLNNPIIYCDHSGQSAVIAKEAGLLLSTLALIDIATPFLEVALIVVSVVAVGALAINAVKESTKRKEETKADTKVVTTSPSDVVIYRYNATKSKNLAPRSGKDYDGLSFSTVPPKSGQKAVATTISAVNATGLLTAVQKGSHVSIVPTGVPVTLWMSMGMDSIWSQTLAAIVVEIEG